MIRKMFIAVAALLCLPWSVVSAENLAIVNANLFDGVNDRIRSNTTVVIRDNLIEVIGGADTRIPAGFEIIDAKNPHRSL